jgi:hypothetical protein
MSFDAEPPQFSTESTPRSRKRRRCCECRGWIEPGERYHRLTGKWNGDIETFETCLQCEDIRQEAYKLNRDSPSLIVLGELRYEITEFLQETEDPRWQTLLDRLDAIRIRRGAAICPIYQAEEAAPPE